MGEVNGGLMWMESMGGGLSQWVELMRVNVDGVNGWMESLGGVNEG